MSVFRRTLLGLFAVSLLVVSSAGWAQQPKRSLTRIAGEVYRFQNNFHYSVVAVTPDGVIATDPINAGAATWLKAELKRRFNKSVRYLIYSHDHRDHIAGGEVFADTALIVAHDRAKRAIIGEKRPTAVPQLTFKKRLTLELGGTVVELIYVGRNHSDNMIVLRFPKERILHAVDFIPVRGVAFRDFPDAYMPDWIESLKRVERLDFDILSPGHGRMGKKEDVALFRGYLEDLHSEVLNLARANVSLQDMQQRITMEQYKSWFGYKRMLKLNVAGMYRLVQGHRRGN